VSPPLAMGSVPLPRMPGGPEQGCPGLISSLSPRGAAGLRHNLWISGSEAGTDASPSQHSQPRLLARRPQVASTSGSPGSVFMPLQRSQTHATLQERPGSVDREPGAASAPDAEAGSPLRGRMRRNYTAGTANSPLASPLQRGSRFGSVPTAARSGYTPKAVEAAPVSTGPAASAVKPSMRSQAWGSLSAATTPGPVAESTEPAAWTPSHARTLQYDASHGDADVHAGTQPWARPTFAAIRGGVGAPARRGRAGSLTPPPILQLPSTWVAPEGGLPDKLPDTSAAEQTTVLAYTREPCCGPWLLPPASMMALFEFLFEDVTVVRPLR
jgi:hypothetical protein